MEKQGAFNPMNQQDHSKHFHEKILKSVKEIIGTDDTTGLELAETIRMLANILDFMTNQRDGENGVSGPRLNILIRLWMDEKMGAPFPLTPTQLSKFENVSKNTISSLIRGLEDQGLVTREIDLNDKRIFRLRITDAGREMVERCAPRKANFLNSLLENLSVEDKTQLLSLLNKLKESLLVQVHGCKMKTNEKK